MPVDKIKLEKKLAQLETYINDVRDMRRKPKSDYTHQSDTEAVAERRLEKALQCVIDIGSYIVAREAMGIPTQYKDVFFFLGRVGVLDTHLVDRLEKMTGFRNNLIHEYETIDPNRVYEIVHSDIDDLTTFAKAVENKYL